MLSSCLAAGVLGMNDVLAVNFVGTLGCLSLLMTFLNGIKS